MSRKELAQSIDDVLENFTGGKWGVGTSRMMLIDIMNKHIRQELGKEGEKAVVTWHTDWEDGE